MRDKPRLFIGDIHGEVDLLKEIIEKFNPSHALHFVGDFLDSFIRTPKEQAECLRIVMKGMENHDWIVHLGNHELSYIHKRFQCSGWNRETNQLVAPYVTFMETCMEGASWFKQEKLLVSHAGLTRQLWDYYKITPENLEETFRGWIGSYNSPLYWIGRCRGGDQEIGGIFWCDWRKEFTPIPGIMQVFGHTQVDYIESVGNNWNIDCLQHTKQVLEVSERGKPQVIAW